MGNLKCKWITYDKYSLFISLDPYFLSKSDTFSAAYHAYR